MRVGYFWLALLLVLIIRLGFAAPAPAEKPAGAEGCLTTLYNYPAEAEPAVPPGTPAELHAASR